MFIAGMVVQFCKTGKDSDHRQGNDKKNGPKQNNHLIFNYELSTMKLLG